MNTAKVAIFSFIEEETVGLRLIFLRGLPKALQVADYCVVVVRGEVSPAQHHDGVFNAVEGAVGMGVVKAVARVECQPAPHQYITDIQ